MKIKVTYSFVYDTDNIGFMNEFQEFQDDHPLTLSALQGFIIDRFINPNFDRGGKMDIEILPLTGKNADLHNMEYR